MAEIARLVVFKLGDELYGANISDIREIIGMMDITKLLNAPSYVPGVINLRGKITVIYNPKKMFEVSDNGVAENRKIIVIDSRNAGFMVDDVKEIIPFDKSAFETAGIMASDVCRNFIEGFVKKDGNIISVINLIALLSFHEQASSVEAIKLA